MSRLTRGGTAEPVSRDQIPCNEMTSASVARSQDQFYLPSISTDGSEYEMHKKNNCTSILAMPGNKVKALQDGVFDHLTLWLDLGPSQTSQTHLLRAAVAASSK